MVESSIYLEEILKRYSIEEIQSIPGAFLHKIQIEDQEVHRLIYASLCAIYYEMISNSFRMELGGERERFSMVEAMTRVSDLFAGEEDILLDSFAIVGGAARSIFLGETPRDIDIALDDGRFSFATGQKDNQPLGLIYHTDISLPERIIGDTKFKNMSVDLFPLREITNKKHNKAEPNYLFDFKHNQIGIMADGKLVFTNGFLKSILNKEIVNHYPYSPSYIIRLVYFKTLLGFNYSEDVLKFVEEREFSFNIPLFQFYIDKLSNVDKNLVAPFIREMERFFPFIPSLFLDEKDVLIEYKSHHEVNTDY